MIKEANRPVVMVDTFAVPKEYDTLGVSSAVFTRRVLDAIQGIENQEAFEDALGTTKADLMLESDTRALVDFEVPETKVSFRTLIQLTQEALGWEPRVVGGEVTLPWATRSRAGVISSESELDQTAIIFRVTQGRILRSLVKFNLPMGDPDEVVKKVAEAIVSNIDPFVFAVYSQKTDPCGAIRVARNMIEDQHIPKSGPRSKAEAYLLWGFALFWQDQELDAKDKFNNALINDPTSALAHNAIANVLSDQGNRRGGELEFRRAIALQPGWVTPRVSLAADLAHDGKWDEARREISEGMRIDPTAPGPHKFLGDLYYVEGNYDGALRQFLKAIDLFPEFAAAYAGVGNVLYSQGDLAGAIHNFDKAVSLDTNLNGDVQAAVAYCNYFDALKRVSPVDLSRFHVPPSIAPEDAILPSNSKVRLPECSQIFTMKVEPIKCDEVSSMK